MTEKQTDGTAAGTVARFLYGALFVVVVPAFLVLFSVTARVPVAVPALPVPGVALGLLGLGVMLRGMWEIWRVGGGLPMNAFPPERLVTGGIYALLPHPIYLGFVLLCLGASLAFGSATGLALTTPIVALSALALVLGHENRYLLRTYGELPRPLLGASRLLGPVARALGLDRLWRAVLSLTGRLANSWSSVRVGPARLINHGVFAGLAGGVGAFLVVLLSGSRHVASISILMLVAILGAALVGQLLVGSSNRLSRPFGYFGGLLGIAAGGAVMYLFDHTMLLVLAAFAFAGPWTQALGRLRCVVQGCCHGSPAARGRGIVVRNEHSRVCALAGLAGTEIHPTQLYSILGNLALGALLVWLWAAAAPLTLIAGLYLALAGVVRFIEEGFRGEPLTRIIGGLHIYQWFSVGMLVAGMLLMMLGSEPAPPVDVSSLGPAAAIGLVFFVVCGFAMGVDFPDSKSRFSRLSG
jgi:protein-S-isoprenylcysteine O-methyltransferase Ste14